MCGVKGDKADGLTSSPNEEINHLDLDKVFNASIKELTSRSFYLISTSLY